MEVPSYHRKFHSLLLPRHSHQVRTTLHWGRDFIPKQIWSPNGATAGQPELFDWNFSYWYEISVSSELQFLPIFKVLYLTELDTHDVQYRTLSSLNASLSVRSNSELDSSALDSPIATSIGTKDTDIVLMRVSSI